MSSVAVSDFIIIIFLSSNSKTCCKCVLPSCVSLACDLCVCPIFFLDSRMSSAGYSLETSLESIAYCASGSSTFSGTGSFVGV